MTRLDIENAIGRLRRYLPRNTNLDRISSQQIDALVYAYNHTPRKCLDFQTPVEALFNHLLHFECESTSPLARGRAPVNPACALFRPNRRWLSARDGPAP